jgi:hypothetical protein
MAAIGSITEYEYDYDGLTWSLYSKPDAVNPYISGLTPKQNFNPTPVARQVGGHTRKRYPGGPNISVKSHTRMVLAGGANLQRTLPGQNAFFEEVIGEGVNKKTVVTTVTHTGPFASLYMYCQANAVRDFVLRSQDGTPWPVTALDD